MDAIIPTTRLDEFTREEWYDILRRVKPDLDRTDFEVQWANFMKWKYEVGEFAGRA